MDKTLSLIKNVPIFSGLNEAELNNIRQIAVHKQYDKGENIFFQDDEAKGFYLIIEGLVKVFKSSSEGKEQILHIFGPGEPFGEVAVFAGASFPAYASALSKISTLFFPRSLFVNLISANPSLAMNMLSVLSMRLRQLTTQIENLTLKEVPARVAAYLIYLAEEQQNNKIVTLKISKGSLAGLLGTIPETLSRIFARLNEQNLIEVNGRNIKLIDFTGLQELTEYGKKIE